MNELIMSDASRVTRSILEPIREDPDFQERWNGNDKGLITCWEVGRTLGVKEPELVQKAKDGELPVLGWKGGVAEGLKLKEKFGSLNYFAQWQGLRGEDLNINLDDEYELMCTNTKVKVTYTADHQKIESGN